MRMDFLRPAVIVAQERKFAMESTTIAMGRLMGFRRLAHLCVEREFGLATRGTGVSVMHLNPSLAWITATGNVTPMNPAKSAAQRQTSNAMGWMTTATG